LHQQHELSSAHSPLHPFSSQDTLEVLSGVIPVMHWGLIVLAFVQVHEHNELTRS
jgi:hypothetical protein